MSDHTPDLFEASCLRSAAGVRSQDQHDPGGRVRLAVRETEVRSRALFSDRGRYRWMLERRWDGRAFGEAGL